MVIILSWSGSSLSPGKLECSHYLLLQVINQKLRGPSCRLLRQVQILTDCAMNHSRRDTMAQSWLFALTCQSFLTSAAILAKNPRIPSSTLHSGVAVSSRFSPLHLFDNVAYLYPHEYLVAICIFDYSFELNWAFLLAAKVLTKLCIDIIPKSGWGDEGRPKPSANRLCFKW